MHTKAVLSGNDARLCKTELGCLIYTIVESTDPVFSFMTEPECPKWATLGSGGFALIFMTEPGCPRRAI